MDAAGGSERDEESVRGPSEGYGVKRQRED
jgi:hypothetical protein